MRSLSPAPSAFVDPETGAPAVGSFAGPLPRVDFGSGMVARALRRKRWWWLAIASDEVWISLAVVRMGYAASAFVFVHDLAARRMLVDRAVIAPPGAAEVTDDPHAAGVLARFGFRKSSVVLDRRGQRASAAPSACELRARFDGLELDVSFDESAAPPPIAAIARLGPSRVSATEKRALMKVRGAAVVGGRRIDLDGAAAGYDYTHGEMARRTRWRWAFAMGRSADGAPVAFNVAHGFVGEAECAAFDASRVHAMSEPTFELDVARPSRPWRLVGDGIDLTFDVGGIYAQNTNLLLVRSRFLQPAGTFRGTLRIDGREVVVDGLPGVAEDQDVVW